ncbi:MAG: hypothetical protein JXK94_09960 [Deltaproteobacteria bacterium]|nr:hypothetical protein [Deltaproteobacteria bacterium]
MESTKRDEATENAVPHGNVSNGSREEREFLRWMDQLSLIISHAATPAARPS